MSLAYGRGQLSIPGPSIIPDRVLQAMHIPSPNIYDESYRAGSTPEPLVALTLGILDDLKVVAGTAHHAVIYIGNGHAAWEAALVNTLQEGELALVLSAGTFGASWGSVAESCGVSVETLDFSLSAPIQMQAVTERLSRDTAHRIKAILVCQTDTSSSLHTDIPALRAAIDSATHPALLMVDCVASFGCSVGARLPANPRSLALSLL